MDGDETGELRLPERGATTPARPEAPEVAPAVDDRFEVLGLLGRGAMGTVWRARDRTCDRHVALKIVAGPFDQDRRRRFEREAQLGAAIDDPGVVRVHAAGVTQDGRLAWIAFELVEGARTLEAAAPFVAGMSADEVGRRVRLVARAARALGRAHRRGIVHRDVKPQNILVAADGAVKVADFGVARPIDASRLTATGVVVGTPLYMAPEQLVGQAVGPTADVWGLGATLHELLTGRPPFEARSILELIGAASTGRLLPLRPQNPAVPEAVEAVVVRALAADPGRRFPDGEALADALERALEAPPRGARLPVRVWGAVVAVAILAVAAAVVVGPRLAPAHEPARAPAPGAVGPARATPDLERLLADGDAAAVLAALEPWDGSTEAATWAAAALLVDDAPAAHARWSERLGRTPEAARPWLAGALGVGARPPLLAKVDAARRALRPLAVVSALPVDESELPPIVECSAALADVEGRLAQAPAPVALGAAVSLQTATAPALLARLVLSTAPKLRSSAMLGAELERSRAASLQVLERGVALRRGTASARALEVAAGITVVLLSRARRLDWPRLDAVMALADGLGARDDMVRLVASAMWLMHAPATLPLRAWPTIEARWRWLVAPDRAALVSTNRLFDTMVLEAARAVADLASIRAVVAAEHEATSIDLSLAAAELGLRLSGEREPGQPFAARVARALLQRGDVAGARARVAGIETREVSGLLAECELREGDPDAALRRLERVWGRHADQAWIGNLQRAAALASGRADLAWGDSFQTDLDRPPVPDLAPPPFLPWHDRAALGLPR